MTMISANRLWKSSGSNLPFKDWLEREKAKGEFIPNIQAQEEFNNADGGEDTAIADGGDLFKKKIEVGSIIGKNLLIIGVVAVSVYFLYKTYKKNA
jgi:hypothetical protein